ncbi:hypothetical protein [Rubrolithibacter danxiaensis]|uniref:hypothetical protein n=1 Tax=Rubrolithibacter danxiaensis TaxID=3390805 RepID=UPI003BF7875F
MSLQFFIRLETVDFLIRTKSTGSPSELASHLNISQRAMYDFLDVMRALGADIKYCKTSKSYLYTNDGSFSVRFQKVVEDKGTEPEESPDEIKRIIARLIEADIPMYSDVMMLLA